MWKRNILSNINLKVNTFFKMGGFRSTVWDPMLIISQIITMQCIFYLGFGVLLLILDFISGHYSSMDQMFSCEELSISINGNGYSVVMMAYAFNIMIMCNGLWFAVQRSKQCLDFISTTHMFHLVFCWIYNGYFPNVTLWWIVNIICVSITTLGGELLCRRSELQEIPLGPKADL